MLNTHFDHESETARRRSARALAGGSLPAIITGDFNAAAHDSVAYTSLVTDGPTVDTWNDAEARLTPPRGTFLDYQAPVEDGGRIDWILTSEDITTLRAAINVSRGGEGRFPSDHAAVQALLALP